MVFKTVIVLLLLSIFDQLLKLNYFFNNLLENIKIIKYNNNNNTEMENSYNGKE